MGEARRGGRREEEENSQSHKCGQVFYISDRKSERNSCTYLL